MSTHKSPRQTVLFGLLVVTGAAGVTALWLAWTWFGLGDLLASIGAKAVANGREMWLFAAGSLGLGLAAVIAALSLKRKMKREMNELETLVSRIATGRNRLEKSDDTSRHASRCAKMLVELGSRIREQEARLEEDASRDPLTGLPNRRVFDHTLKRELALAQRTGWAVCLVMVDLDRFKDLNDKYGHQAGDQVLKRTASRLSSLVRESDLLARFGGEEFALILPGTQLTQGAQIAQELRDALRGDSVRVGSQDISVTASFGVAESFKGRAGNAETLLHDADAALYDAKSRGRDRVAVAPRRSATQEQTTHSPDGPSSLPPAEDRESLDPPDHPLLDRDALALMGSTFSILRVTPDRERVCQDIVQQVVAIVPCVEASAMVVDESEGQLGTWASWHESTGLSTGRGGVTDECQEWVNRRRRELGQVSERTFNPEVTAVDAGGRQTGLMRVPMMTQDELLGVIEARGDLYDFDLSERQQTVLRAISAIGAAALRICGAFKRAEGRWVDLIEAVCNAINSRDVYKRDRAERVSRMSVVLARAMGLQDHDELQLMRVAGLVHDIGKIFVPREVLGKKRRLRNRDREALEEHAKLGGEVLEKIPGMERLADIVRHHHERYDGAGYPDGLSGDDIPIECRLLAVADAYDAMTSERPHRPAFTHEEAIEQIRHEAGRQFDPGVVQAMLEVFGPDGGRARFILGARLGATSAARLSADQELVVR